MECAWEEVEFYMGMVAKEEPSFEGLSLTTYMMPSIWVRLLVSSLAIFMVSLKRPERPRTPLVMTCRCQLER